jgi:hypothetical protein
MTHERPCGAFPAAAIILAAKCRLLRRHRKFLRLSNRSALTLGTRKHDSSRRSSRFQSIGNSVDKIKAIWLIGDEFRRNWIRQ